MSKIKNKNTKPEFVVRKYLFSQGLRYRLNVGNLPGKPDIVLPKFKTIVNVNGCFWHGHLGCKDFKLPKTRTDWWNDKISKTKLRDAVNLQKLKNDSWKVITIWECQLKPDQKTNTLQQLIEKITNA